MNLVRDTIPDFGGIGNMGVISQKEILRHHEKNQLVYWVSVSLKSGRDSHLGDVFSDRLNHIYHHLTIEKSNFEESRTSELL